MEKELLFIASNTMVSKMREVCASEQHSVVSPFCKNVMGRMYMYVGTSVEGGA